MEVRQDTIRSVTVVATGSPVTHTPMDAWPTVEELFAAVERAILGGAHVLEVTYDPVLGYPESVYIDHQEMIADDEIGYQVFDLEAVQ